MHTNLGRPDLVIFYDEKYWIIELKVAYKGKTAKYMAKSAIKQIIDNNYAAPFPDAFCIGMGIDDSKRMITNYCLKP
jgi:hypothetical protein